MNLKLFLYFLFLPLVSEVDQMVYKESTGE